MLPALLNASDIGNSPPDDIGCPTMASTDGRFWLIENRETVFEPGYIQGSVTAQR
jgi:hypothetical protein